MKKRKLGLLALALSVMTAFSACSGKTKTETEPTSGAEETYEATMAFLAFGNAPKDLQQVQDEINKITIPKVNVKVKLMPINAAQFGQQVNLMMSGSEKLDLVSVFYDQVNGYVSKGQIIKLDDLLNKYGSGIKSTIDEKYRKITTYNGNLYTIPSNGAFAGSVGIQMRKDIVEKYNIDLSNVKTFEDFEAVLKTVHEKEPNLPLMVSPLAGQGALGAYTTADTLGDGVGVLKNYGQDDLKVTNWYETDEYANLVKLMRKWYNAGYIAKDIATSKESTADLFKAGKAFAAVCPLRPYIDESNTTSYGNPLVSVQLTKTLASTNVIQSWGIARNSQNPEKTMQLLDLMYTSKEINNLLSWGIEGKHYAKTSDANVIDYPAGVDAKTTGYGLNMGWEFPNSLVTYVWKGTPSDMNEKTIAYKDSAIVSKSMGFTFDTASVKTEIAAVTNVLNQYRAPIESGSVDPEKILPEFISKLKSSGIDKIIAEKQKQLDTWAKTQK